MKTDQALKDDIEAELAWDPLLDASGVSVKVQGGVVTLDGEVASEAEKMAAEQAVQRVHGVLALGMGLQVRPWDGVRRSDEDLAFAAEQALHWNALVPLDRVRLRVERGEVALEGEVDWQFQRRSAELTVRSLRGVRAVHNHIQLRPRTTPADLLGRIEGALTRQALREARHVQMQIDGGTVTLLGQVHSWAERQAIEGVVWSAPGVSAVRNQLQVGP